MTKESSNTKQVDAFVQSRIYRPHWGEVALELRPSTVSEGYRLQADVYRRLSSARVRQIGYKIGCTALESRRPFGLKEPIYSGIFEHTRAQTLRDGVSRLFVKPAIECEVAFRIKSDIDGKDFEQSKIIDAIGETFIACEIVDNRYGTDPANIGVPTLLVDDFLHAAFILGVPCADVSEHWLLSPRGSIEINGKSYLEAPSDPLPPLEALGWLARKLAENGDHLREGQIVMTGSLFNPLPIDKPESLTMTIENLGSISLSD